MNETEIDVFYWFQYSVTSNLGFSHRETYNTILINTTKELLCAVESFSGQYDTVNN